jgi:hypothetical protein
MPGSIFSGSVKELQKYVPQVVFLECPALGTCSSELIDCMLVFIFISRSVKELQKYVPQVGFLADQVHALLHRF